MNLDERSIVVILILPQSLPILPPPLPPLPLLQSEALQKGRGGGEGRGGGGGRGGRIVVRPELVLSIVEFVSALSGPG